MKRAFIALACLSLPLFAQASIKGTWEGAIQIQGIELSTVVTFASEGDELTATIDIPQQNARGLELKNVSFDDPRVHFELDAGVSMAIFDGELADGEIKGSFTQGPAEGEFYLNPAEKKEPEVLPYAEEEVSIKVNDDVTLAGTLTIPEGEGPFTAVILITGSGAQDRNEEIFGFKPFAIIADHLTRNGIVVLRCDDRGFASSTGDRSQATTEDFADDVLAQVTYLKTRSEIDTSHIGLLGHSEGGIIAPMVDVKSDDIEFVVLMAGTALPGEQILLAQQRAILMAEQIPEDQIEEAADLQKRIFAALLSGNEAELEALKPEIRKSTAKSIKKMPRNERKALGNLKEYVNAQIQQGFAAIQTPWYEFFLTHDPRENLAKMDARVLAFFGEKDRQVLPDMNAKALEETFAQAGKTDYIIKTCCKANHLFQSAETGRPSEYGSLPKEFTPCFLPAVTAWILEQPIPDECDHGDGDHPEGSGCGAHKEEGCQKAREGGCPKAGKHNK